MLDNKAANKTALVISAHAADFVWRCGGAIALHQKLGYDVTICCLSFGERGESAKLWKKEGMTLDKVKASRRGEAEEAAKALNAHDIVFFDQGDYPVQLYFYRHGTVVHQLSGIRGEVIAVFSVADGAVLEPNFGGKPYSQVRRRRHGPRELCTLVPSALSCVGTRRGSPLAVRRACRRASRASSRACRSCEQAEQARLAAPAGELKGGPARGVWWRGGGVARGRGGKVARWRGKSSRCARAARTRFRGSGTRGRGEASCSRARCRLDRGNTRRSKRARD